MRESVSGERYPSRPPGVEQRAYAVSAGLSGGDRDLGRSFVVLVLALLNVLQDQDTPTGRGLPIRNVGGLPYGAATFRG
jgi:hypothetical protein